MEFLLPFVCNREPVYAYQSKHFILYYISYANLNS